MKDNNEVTKKDKLRLILSTYLIVLIFTYPIIYVIVNYNAFFIKGIVFALLTTSLGLNSIYYTLNLQRRTISSEDTNFIFSLVKLKNLFLFAFIMAFFGFMNGTVIFYFFTNTSSSNWWWMIPYLGTFPLMFFSAKQTRINLQNDLSEKIG